MATWYTDVAIAQAQNLNFPDPYGQLTLTSQPSQTNIPQFEGPLEITATYTWTGNEAANDVINIAIASAGLLVDPNGHISSGVTAPATTLVVSIGDNDLGSPSSLPIPNPQALVAQPAYWVAPTWVSGTSYAPGNVVIDATSTPANLTYTCVSATSGTTAPHSAATTVWMPNYQRYASGLDIHAASGNVAFAGGTQLYGGPALSLNTGSVATGYPTTAIQSNQPYVIQNDCWLQALITSASGIVANTVSVFRIPLVAAN